MFGLAPVIDEPEEKNLSRELKMNKEQWEEIVMIVERGNCLLHGIVSGTQRSAVIGEQCVVSTMWVGDNFMWIKDYRSGGAREERDGAIIGQCY